MVKPLYLLLVNISQLMAVLNLPWELPFIPMLYAHDLVRVCYIENFMLTIISIVLHPSFIVIVLHNKTVEHVLLPLFLGP